MTCRLNKTDFLHPCITVARMVPMHRGEKATSEDDESQLDIGLNCLIEPLKLLIFLQLH